MEKMRGRQWEENGKIRRGRIKGHIKYRLKKKLEGRWEKLSVNAGGASPTSQTAIPTPRPRWADICEEEEQKERNARAAAAADASGESENTVDHVEAEAANAKASEARELRGKVCRNLFRQ